MNLTKNLREWALKNLKVTEESTDEQIKEAIGMALATGVLSTSKFSELTVEEGTGEENELVSLLKGLNETVQYMKSAMEKTPTPTEKKVDEKEGEVADDKKTPTEKETPRTQSRFEKMVLALGGHSYDGGEEKEFNVRVKEAAEQYSTTKSTLLFPSVTEKGRVHPFAGKPVKSYGEGEARTLDEPSELDKAVNGAVAKLLCATAVKKSKTLAFMSLPQHDKELLCYAMESMKWCGATDGGDKADIIDRKLTEFEQKALIEDSVSGGIEAVPIVFDDAVIMTPFLHGELFPLVNSIPLDRGRRVEGVQVGQVTGGWGGYDDAAIDLFDTSSYVDSFDTTIWRWEGAIRIGLDFISDSPIDFGSIVTGQYGERLLEDLDDAVATGSGLNEPEGVMTKSGTTSVSFGGATSIGNYESLRYSVTKKEHRSNLVSTAVFCGNETSFSRMKAIPVGASDDRRLFGAGNFGTEGYDDYRMMNRRYAINESLTNRQIFYAILGRYRMYRRRGLTMRTSQEGDFLIRRNEMLMVGMARYGGQLERGAVAGVTSTAEA